MVSRLSYNLECRSDAPSIVRVLAPSHRGGQLSHVPVRLVLSSEIAELSAAILTRANIYGGRQAGRM